MVIGNACHGGKNKEISVRNSNFKGIFGRIEQLLKVVSWNLGAHSSFSALEFWILIFRSWRMHNRTLMHWRHISITTSQQRHVGGQDLPCCAHVLCWKSMRWPAGCMLGDGTPLNSILRSMVSNDLASVEYACRALQKNSSATRAKNKK